MKLAILGLVLLGFAACGDTSHAVTVAMNATDKPPAYGTTPFPTDAVRDGDHLGAIAGLDALSAHHVDLITAHVAALDGFGLRPLVEFFIASPMTAGSYWWYASYNGDGNNTASVSTCGAGMASTVVGKATTGLTANALFQRYDWCGGRRQFARFELSGTAGAGGSITFTVFGPQASAPTSCGSGGTQVGIGCEVSGSGTYHPSAGFTPSAAGTYWWYASYGGDANNAASNSTCGSGMTSTVVKATTTTTVSAPGSSTAGVAIASGSISGDVGGCGGGCGWDGDVHGVRSAGERADELWVGWYEVGSAVSVSGGDVSPVGGVHAECGGDVLVVCELRRRREQRCVEQHVRQRHDLDRGQERRRRPWVRRGRLRRGWRLRRVRFRRRWRVRGRARVGR